MFVKINANKLKPELKVYYQCFIIISMFYMWRNKILFKFLNFFP